MQHNFANSRVFNRKIAVKLQLITQSSTPVCMNQQNPCMNGKRRLGTDFDGSAITLYLCDRKNHEIFVAAFIGAFN